MRCVIWAAVSSEPQTEKAGKASIPEQIRACREFIERNGYEEVHEPLVVEGHTRSYGGRTPLDDAIRDMPDQYGKLDDLAKKRQIDLVICSSRDRLARTEGLRATLEEYLKENDVRIYSLRTGSAISDSEEFRTRQEPGDVLISGIEGTLAHYEVAQLVARRRIGMIARTQKGQHPNRPPFGYQKGADGVPTIDEDEAALVRLVFDWFLAGDNYHSIAQKIRIQSGARSSKNAASVRYMLKCPTYAGFVEWGSTRSKGQHTPIIDLETWQRVQDEIKRRREESPQTHHTKYPLSGFIYCLGCEQSMRIDRGISNDRQYYICARNDCGFGRNSIRRDVIEEWAAEWIKFMCRDPFMLGWLREKLAEFTTNELGPKKQEIQRLQKSLSKAKKDLAKWEEDYLDELLPRADFYQKRDELQESIKEIEDEIQKKQEEIDRHDPDEILSGFTQFSTLGDIANLEQWWIDPKYVANVKMLLARLEFRIWIAPGDSLHERISVSIEDLYCQYPWDPFYTIGLESLGYQALA